MPGLVDIGSLLEWLRPPFSHGSRLSSSFSIPSDTRWGHGWHFPFPIYLLATLSSEVGSIDLGRFWKHVQIHRDWRRVMCFRRSVLLSTLLDTDVFVQTPNAVPRKTETLGHDLEPHAVLPVYQPRP